MKLHLLFAAIMAFLVACGGNDTTGPVGSANTVSGTVSAPPGGDVANTLVIVCFVEAGQCNAQSPNTTRVSVSTGGAAASFSVPNVAAGQYLIAAFKDVNSNNAYGDAGDYQGVYSLDGTNPAPVSPPAGGLNIQMAAIGGGGGNTPGGNLAGSATAPAGGDVANTAVVACFLEANQCNVNSPNTKSVVVSTGGTTGNFTVSGLIAGQYLVVGFKYVNANGQVDAGDYLGCVGDASGCTTVTPPQTALSIPMQVQGAAPGPGTPGGVGSILGTLVFPGSRGGLGVSDDVLDKVSSFSVQPVARFSSAFVPGEVVVKFRSEVGARSLSVQGQTLRRVQSLGVPGAALYRTDLDARGTLGLIDELSARPDVLYAEPNYLRSIARTPNDELYPFQWHYEAMNLPAAWDVTNGTGGNVTVAIVDTGSLAHPDLQGVFVGGYDFVSDAVNGGDGDGYDADPTDLGQDSSYHGTHVAGTVAARSNDGVGVAGVSWGARVLPVRTLGVTGGGSNTDTVNGVLWAAGEPVAGVPINPNPAQVINLSLGGEAPCSGLEQEAFDRVRAKGVTVVVAAGNEDSDAGFYAPANCDGVIVVGATGPQGERAPYSNYGSRVQVMAPGGDTAQTLTLQGETVPAGVLSTIGDGAGGYTYGFYQGTSMATPHIAGLVALMLAQEPTLDPDTILSRLQSSATPLSDEACGQPGGCGAGLVDAAAALGGTDAPTPGPTPPPVTGSATTYVAALYCVAECGNFDSDRSGLVEVATDALQVPFRIDNLEPGTYVVAAWQDLNGDVEVNEGEPFGRHLNNLTLQAGQELDRADIYLQPFTPARGAFLSFFRQTVAQKQRTPHALLKTIDLDTLGESNLLNEAKRLLEGQD